MGRSKRKRKKKPTYILSDNDTYSFQLPEGTKGYNVVDGQFMDGETLKFTLRWVDFPPQNGFWDDVEEMLEKDRKSKNKFGNGK